MSGTSMAAPMVTGVLALVWSEHPNWSYQQVINQVLSTVDPVPGLQGKVLTGGVLDAARAVGYNPTTPTPPADTSLQVVSSTSSGATSGTLDSITLTFSAPVDPAVLNNGNVTLTGPNGQNVPLQSFQPVPGSNGTQVTVSLPAQSAPGAYTLTVDSAVTSTSGATLAANYQNTFSLEGTVSPDAVYQFSTTNPIGVPDVSQMSTSLTVSQSIVIGKVTVSVNIVNSVDSKMELVLQAPDGTNVVLADLAGGNGTNFNGTVFDDASGTPIQSGEGPFTGSYRPQSALSALIGKNAQGTWRLSVVDHATNYFVVLTGWSLTISGPGGTSTIASVAPGSDAGAAGAGANFVAVAPSPAQGASVASGVAAEARISAGVLASVNAPALPGGPPAPSEIFGAVRSTQVADELFASLDGVDRLAELRVMMPHANRANQFADETLTDELFLEDGTDDAESVDVATVALLDP
jgi:subtilisin-like proprotein convertase family protein